MATIGWFRLSRQGEQNFAKSAKQAREGLRKLPSVLAFDPGLSKTESRECGQLPEQIPFVRLKITTFANDKQSAA